MCASAPRDDCDLCRLFLIKGQVYKIDKIKDICRRAADVGGVGDRYTCMIQGKERELWFEDGRWFVAAKVATKQAPPSNA